MKNRNCGKTGVSRWCNNHDVRMVQLKDGFSPNTYNGAIVPMCKECRKSNNGGFKFVKSQTPYTEE